MLSVYMLIYYRDSKSVISIYMDILTGNCKYTCMYIYIYIYCMQIYTVYIYISKISLQATVSATI